MHQYCADGRFTGRKWIVYHYLLITLIYLLTRFLISNAKETKVCETESCKKTAATIKSYMNTSVDPCDNFYQHVCGNFPNTAIIKAGVGENSSFTVIEDKVLLQLKTRLEAGISDKDPRTFAKLKSFYDVCMNEEAIDSSSKDEFLKLLDELGGWPVLKGSSSEHDWIKTTYALREKGYFFDGFVALSVDIDAKNTSRKRITIGQPSFKLISQDYLLDDSQTKIKSAYKNYKLDMAKALGASHDDLELELKKVFDLEVRLAKISLSPSEQREMDNFYHPTSISELQEKYPYITWVEYLNNYLSSHKVITPEDTVILCAPKYFDKLKDVLADTEARTLVNYEFWWVVSESASLLSEPIRKIQRDFNAVWRGSSAELPRWQECIEAADDVLPLATGAIYAREHHDESVKERVTKIVEDVRSSFMGVLSKIKWMDKKTKDAALNKLKHILPLVAYPDEMLDNRKLDDYHESLNLKNKSFLQAKLRVNLFNTESFIKTLDESYLRSDWRGMYGHATMVNAYYEPKLNVMFFPSAFLQAPFFDAENPKFVNYASIGFFAGHEITHGFDDQGCQYDEEGRLTNWWNPKTKEEFKKKVECVIDQYSHYNVDGLNLNGENTQGENVADNGGAGIARAAWKSTEPDDSALPGFESYTQGQMFWISFAHTFCTKSRPEFLKDGILTDVHSPAQFRVDGTVSNLREFAKDFKCSEGSPMNPKNKCHVW